MHSVKHDFYAVVRQLVFGLGVLLASFGAQAQACNIAASAPMLFGSYNPLSFTDQLAQTSVSARCIGLGNIRVLLGAGLAGTVSDRRMQRNGVDLPYGLYTNSARTTLWGNGTGGTSVVTRFVFIFSEFTLPIYGRIPARQNIPVGFYSDSVTVQFEF